jgi:hypothetical protein
MKTAIQQLVDIMNEDQVSFTEWFQDNYQMYIEKEKEQVVDAFNEGIDEMAFATSGINYYNQTYNQ